MTLKDTAKTLYEYTRHLKQEGLLPSPSLGVPGALAVIQHSLKLALSNRTSESIADLAAYTFIALHYALEQTPPPPSEDIESLEKELPDIQEEQEEVDNEQEERPSS